MSKRLTSAAALLGAKGGAAGRGAAKVRGDHDYYSRMRLTGLARKKHAADSAQESLTGPACEGPAGIIPPLPDDAAG